MANYRAIAAAAARAYHLNPGIFMRQINQESGFNPNAHSGAGADGIAQFIPSTARRYGVNTRDPVSSLYGAAHFDSDLLHQYGSYARALSAYNSGRADAYKDPGFAHGQTYNYVRSILGGSNPSVGGNNSPTPNVAVPNGAPTGHNGLSQNQVMTALALLTNAQSTISGKPPEFNLFDLATLRNQLGAAQQTYGNETSTSYPHSTTSPDVHGGTNHPGLNGNVAMVSGGKSPYSNIRFDSHVDWRHVNPRLLRSVNQVAASSGKVVTINSGYRSNDYSRKVGGFAGDPHSKGLAVDAYVNGVPIGHVWGPHVWKARGVRSGDTFTYHGKPDPEHLDLLLGA